MFGSIFSDTGCNKLLQGLSQAVTALEKIGVSVFVCAMCPSEHERNPLEHNQSGCEDGSP